MTIRDDRGSHPTRSGNITLPAEVGEEELVLKLAELWGADAIRDSDGTKLSPELLALGLEVYSTTCLVRAEQTYPHEHPEHLPQKFLMSDPVTATASELTIDLLAGFFREKYVVDALHDCHRYWEVIDRTTAEVIPTDRWTFDAEAGTVTITDVTPFHRYTVNFLVFQIWDSTSMYNHLTNGWTTPHVMSTDPYHPAAWDHLMDHFDAYLAAHEQTDVVRLTSLAYHFPIDSDASGADRFRDWTGYQDTVSVPALEDFAAEHGYRLRSEDFVDEGYYNSASRVPSERYLAWMRFIHRFVVRYGRELVRRANAAGKRTAMFWGDHWAGTEPHLPSFQEIGLDIHIGAAEDGVAVRRVSDAPGNLITELRLYPYFFPDVFAEDGTGDPTAESLANWLKIRRALLRKSVDRLGYGGYLRLTNRYPEFIEHVTGLIGEFRSIQDNSGGQPSHVAPIKVGVLNAWGVWKPWLNSFGAPQKFLVKRPDVIEVAGTNLLECLAGLPVEVEFLDLADVARDGVPADITVLINDGDAETAWSGGHWWADPRVVASVRQFVHGGGGLIGCRGPSAWQHQGRYFQLSDLFGVDKETGRTLQTSAIVPSVPESHFITADLGDAPEFGTEESFVYVAEPDTAVLAASGNHVLASARQAGKGRAVFLSELPYNLANARLLHRAIFWAAGAEDELTHWFSSNPSTECAYYPGSGQVAVVNNSAEEQVTTITRADGTSFEVTVPPHGLVWA